MNIIKSVPKNVALKSMAIPKVLKPSNPAIGKPAPERKIEEPDELRSEKQYFTELSRVSLLSLKEERAIFSRIKRNDGDARRQLIESNLRLVVSIAKQYIKSGVPLMDLIQEGNIGLLRAIEKYDIRKGTKFSTYAVYQIRHSILRSIANKARMIRIPVNLIEKRNKIEQANARHFKDFGLDASVEVLSGLTDYSKTKIENILKYFQPIMSLETCKNIEEEMHVVDDIFRISNLSSPEMIFFGKFVREEVEKVLENLDERAKYILKMYFGLNNKKKSYTLKELGKMYNLTRERIRQIKKEAISKMQKRIQELLLE